MEGKSARPESLFSSYAIACTKLGILKLSHVHMHCSAITVETAVPALAGNYYLSRCAMLTLQLETLSK